jgi:hypothetical protein
MGFDKAMEITYQTNKMQQQLLNGHPLRQVKSLTISKNLQREKAS